MPNPSPITIVNVGYRSTNFWVVSAGPSRIIIDLGWPGTMGRMLANLKRMDVPLEQLHFGLATHYHIDHAGLAQEFKQAGVPLLVLDVQVSAIPIMKTWIKPQDNHLGLTMDGNIITSFSESRAILGRIGIPGEIYPTPGHSDDSVSLLLDDGSAFTGDLPLPDFVAVEDIELVLASWRLLAEYGARRVYPGHGPARPMAAISMA